MAPIPDHISQYFSLPSIYIYIALLSCNATSRNLESHSVNLCYTDQKPQITDYLLKNSLLFCNKFIIQMQCFCSSEKKCLPCQGSGPVPEKITGEEELVMVTRSDGKIMEYTAPLLARDLMAAYPLHSLVHSEDATCLSLSPDQKLVPGQLYRLLLIPNSPSLSEDVVLSEATSIDDGGISKEWRGSTSCNKFLQLGCQSQFF